MWKASLEASGYHCIYFNAWENDFSEDPFISFVSHFKEGLPENQTAQFLSKAKNLGAFLLKRALPVAARLATHGIVNINPDVDGALEDLSQNISEDAIEKYSETKASIENFKESLKALAKDIGQAEPSQPKPVIIFVDELDRCRPTYAVQLLERIKHIFTVEGIIFVLSIDRKQLGGSLRCLYGNNTDTESYLKRIIDLDFALPIPTKRNFLFACLEKTQVVELLRDRQIDARIIAASILNTIEFWDFSLREVEHYCVVFNTILKTQRNIGNIPFQYLIFILGAKIRDKELYERYMSDQDASKAIIQRLKEKVNDDNIIPVELIGYLIVADANKSNLKTLVDNYLVDYSGTLKHQAEDFEQNLLYFFSKLGHKEGVKVYTDRLINNHLSFF